MKIMGNPDWALEEWCQDLASRRPNWDVISLLINEWTIQHTTREVEQAALVERVPCTVVRSAQDMLNNEQLVAREFFVDIDHKVAGKIKYPGAPYKMSATPWCVRRPAPELGEHNEQVYCGMMKFNRQDLVRLGQAGVI
jgi:crotonobetainyl-CoA:carnitine CoA-transferase CaiB-like acyl-CoA transferase